MQLLALMLRNVLSCMSNVEAMAFKARHAASNPRSTQDTLGIHRSLLSAKSLVHSTASAYLDAQQPPRALLYRQENAQHPYKALQMGEKDSTVGDKCSLVQILKPASTTPSLVCAEEVSRVH